ncbi:hypothetical protein NKF06_08535 [Haloferax sp. AB510]|uniref:hypothetical protein n=1 Tax=Haloferax TaxID=2251 RepID=UPI00067851AA|nr:MULTISPECIES: hypothetical protein [Haloferax]MCO8266630.1 hypothetical protein [Haloferax sp. AB510]RDZ39384.1 hypothetical protein C5B86_19305 [Haloferax sp. Atlit-19N]
MRKGLNHRFHDLPLVDEIAGLVVSVLILYWLAFSAIVAIGIVAAISVGFVSKAFPMVGPQWSAIVNSILFSDITSRVGVFVLLTSVCGSLAAGAFLALDYLTNVIDTVLRKVGILGGS